WGCRGPPERISHVARPGPPLMPAVEHLGLAPPPGVDAGGAVTAHVMAGQGTWPCDSRVRRCCRQHPLPSELHVRRFDACSSSIEQRPCYGTRLPHWPWGQPGRYCDRAGYRDRRGAPPPGYFGSPPPNPPAPPPPAPSAP